jgi:hypothetical protein
MENVEAGGSEGGNPSNTLEILEIVVADVLQQAAPAKGRNPA